MPQTPTPTDTNQCAATVKNQDIIETKVARWKKHREQSENTQNIPGNKNRAANNSNSNNNFNKNNNNHKNSWKAGRKPKTVYPRYETCEEANHSTEECYFTGNAANKPPPRHRRPEGQNQVQERTNQSDSNEIVLYAAQKLT